MVEIGTESVFVKCKCSCRNEVNDSERSGTSMFLSAFSIQVKKGGTR